MVAFAGRTVAFRYAPVDTRFTTPLRLSTMTRLRSLALLALLPLAASCGRDQAPSPAAPILPPATTADGLLGNGGLLEGLLSPVTGLLRCHTTSAYASSAVIGAAGGTLNVGPHQLIVPPNALRAPTRISASAPRGQYVEVQFQPEGLRFERPVAIALSYRHCGVVRGIFLKVVYVDSQRSILQVLPSLPDLFNRRVFGKTDHFSGYMLAD